MMLKKQAISRSSEKTTSNTDNVENLIEQVAGEVHDQAKQIAKRKFAELMKIAREDELDPYELELYYDAFADLTRVPEEMQAFVLRELKRLIDKGEEPEEVEIVEGKIVSQDTTLKDISATLLPDDPPQS